MLEWWQPLLAVAAIAATVWAARRWGSRRKRLESDFVAVALVDAAAAPADAHVQVLVDGRKMTSPHSVLALLTNVGHRDVRPDDFPDGRGRLVIQGCTAMGSLQGQLLGRTGNDQSPQKVKGRPGDSPTSWEFDAVHIPRGATLRFTGVVDGSPTSAELDPLYDVEVYKTLSRIRTVGTIAYVTGALAAVFMIAVFVLGSTSPTSPWIGIAAILVLVNGVFCFMFWLGDTALRRRRIRRQTLARS